MEARDFLYKYSLEYYKNNWHIENKNRELSWTGQVAKALDGKNINMAAGGASMIKIYHTLLSQIDRIKNTPNAIVLVGTTTINRNSKFMDKRVCHPFALDGIWDKGQTFDNDGVAHHIDVKALAELVDPRQQNMNDAARYLILEDEFNDCTLSKWTYNIGIIYAIKHLLKDIPHVVADMFTSVNNPQHFQERYVSNESINVVNSAYNMCSIAANELYPIALFDYAKDVSYNSDYLCSFEHVMPVYHELYATNVVRYLKEKFDVNS